MRTILVTYLLLLSSLCYAQTDAKVLTEVKLINFDPATIPSAYFSPDLNEAKALLISGDSKKAGSIIDTNIKSTTKRSPLQKAYILEGLMKYKEGKYTDAVSAYDNYFKLNAANSDVLFLKGQALLKAGKTDKALEALNEAVWFNKFSFLSPAEVNLQISNIYISADDALKANEFLTKALTANASSPGALLALSDLQLKENKKPEALANLRKALIAQPENQEIKLSLSGALLTNVNRTNHEKEISEAKTLSKEVLDKPGSPEIEQRAAGLHIKAMIEHGDLEDAATLLKVYLKKFPANEIFQTLQKQLKIEVAGKNLKDSKEKPAAEPKDLESEESE